ncbi:hypothetical protein F0L68_39735 [Solihabitans fulvus]|uniref:Uncharacterized protein n=1 Tax=Solihabitans fulvus TaxID=1892852 RepID=A0A5B2W9L7_9PSEU|nr:hypothetical protein [Solihabitans fulvus]KAA2248683.1 hypothetical protein F0L68_39735 [Solihabitans fulvus]
MPGHRATRPERVAAWRDRYWQRLRRVKTDVEQLSVALDHLRLALTKCATPEQRQAIVATAVADLVAPAEELLARYESRGRTS